LKWKYIVVGFAHAEVGSIEDYLHGTRRGIGRGWQGTSAGGGLKRRDLQRRDSLESFNGEFSPAVAQEFFMSW
jgi:hypothetical protein